jgi:hypothetical protein
MIEGSAASFFDSTTVPFPQHGALIFPALRANIVGLVGAELTTYASVAGSLTSEHDLGRDDTCSSYSRSPRDSAALTAA